MANSNSSIGRGPAYGGNENHDGDPQRKTLGETVQQEPPAGNELIDKAVPDLPVGVPGAKPKPGIARAPGSYPDGPNAASSPWKPDAARGKLPSK